MTDSMLPGSLSGSHFRVREGYLKTIGNVQLVSGIVLLGFSLWLLLKSLDYPQSGIYLVVLELGIFSLIVISCGLVLKIANRFKITSLWFFVFATAFVYIDFCTPFAGWYLR